MGVKQFPLSHYLLATEGIALIRSWALDDESRSRQFLGEVADICSRLDEPPLADALASSEGSVVTGYTAWAPSYDEENRHNPLVRLETDVLDQLLHPPTSPGHALDAACGTGRQSGWLQALGHAVTGVDTTPAMLEVARRTHPQVRYLEGDLRALPVDDGSFDLVVATLAVTHVTELDQVISEFARVLVPGGQAVIVDVHPVQVLLGAHVMVASTTAAPGITVRNHMHLPSRYLAEFKRVGLRVEQCLEPPFDEKAAAELPAAPHFPEANRAAFVGTPALLAWSLRKDAEVATV